MRIVVFICIAVVLVQVNVWFGRWAISLFFSCEFIIAPFEVVQQAGDERSSANLARLLNARLGTLQRELHDTRRSAPSTPQGSVPPTGRDQSPMTTTLFIPQEVVIPTGLLQPININVTVGGVEVGGIISWLQKTITQPRTLTFTVFERGERAIVSADLKGFVTAENPYLWFESANSADEIATNVAYALIQTRLSQAANSQIATLDLPDFRTLLNSILRVEVLNVKVRRGYVVDKDFASLLPDIERLAAKVPQWHELMYFIGNVAERGGNHVKAVTYYRRVRRALETPEARARLNPAIAKDVDIRLAAFGIPAETPAGEAEQKFIEAASKFADLMDLPGDDPAIVFKKPEMPEIQAQWSTEARRYEVNPDFAETPGLPQYVALMGRFFEKNFDKCKDAQAVDGMFWNEFRHSTVGYLIRSVRGFSNVTNIGSEYPLYQALKRLDDQSPEAVKRLVLELLWNFDWDWKASNLYEHILAINNERGLFPEKALQQAFAARADEAAAPGR